MKRDARDCRFSKAVRQRDNWTCRRCGKQHAENSCGLHAAHLFSRRHKTTRWLLENSVALCYGCHRYIDTHPVARDSFAISEIGADAYELLRQVSQRLVKTHDFEEVK